MLDENKNSINLSLVLENDLGILVSHVRLILAQMQDGVICFWEQSGLTQLLFNVDTESPSHASTPRSSIYPKGNSLFFICRQKAREMVKVLKRVRPNLLYVLTLHIIPHRFFTHKQAVKINRKWFFDFKKILYITIFSPPVCVCLAV